MCINFLKGEHEIDESGRPIDKDALGHAEYLLSRSASDNRYRPRAILVDLDCSGLDQIKQSSLGKLFKQQNIIASSELDFFGIGRQKE